MCVCVCVCVLFFTVVAVDDGGGSFVLVQLKSFVVLSSPLLLPLRG